ncbi:competence type IV pilus major pilin ComGC [Alkalihalobacillus sp. CinArs1]|uniref:competence type IV pilus major pilin ComGC n=1 Tax=Alkalihalobacillus sp. CinArs1 TaxID=2995314 RepID=UPI0022DDADED|nr:competence type IV pilus major pilin ComGC [Alkalihalobacillus sp. CinArs1]
MRILIKKEAGFTLIEMMIVIMIISMLLLIAVPSLTKNNEVVGEKSCDATVKVVKAQVAAYKADNDSLPTSISTLTSEGYLEEGATVCPSGEAITIDGSGVVSVESTS